jgi:diguanylate cyclase (GGDEF)-like protein
VATSELRLTHRALDVYSRVLRATLDAVDQAVLLIDERGEVLLCNQAFARLAGLGPGYRFELRDLRAALEALGATVDDSELNELLQPTAGPTTLELQGERTVLCTVAPVPLEDDGEGRMIALREITSERRELRELEHRALHDDLSGLPNRDLLMDRLERALSRQAREGGAVGVVFLDLDGFKTVNDRHGHAAGDRILIEVAARLQRELRDADTVGRLGGDEFVVICDGLENDAALARICERIQDRVAQLYQLGAAVLTLTASLGAVLEWDHSVPPAQVVERADAMMYAAKRRSSRREIFVDGYPPEGGHRRREARPPHAGRWLREALDSGQLTLAFLPIVTVDEQRTVAIEGLLRCDHPELRGLTPTQLVELVDEAGLLERFDEWALGEAARAARLLRDTLGSPVSVIINLSDAQLAHSAVPAATAKAVAEHDIGAELIGFDISEAIVATNPPWLGSSLAALRDLDCSLMVDDVTSFDVNAVQLRDLGFSGLKLDRPVVGRSMDDPDFAASARAQVSRARAQGLSVVGEGVDDEQRLQAVRELGCDSAQGFGFHGFPRTVEELLKLIDGDRLT